VGANADVWTAEGEVWSALCCSVTADAVTANGRMWHECTE